MVRSLVLLCSYILIRHFLWAEKCTYKSPEFLLEEHDESPGFQLEGDGALFSVLAPFHDSGLDRCIFT